MAKEYVGRSGYASREIEACNSVLLELSHILGEFRDSMVLVGGVEAIAEKLRPIMSNALVREALGYLRKGFESVDHFGPGMVSDFEEIDDPEEIARIRRDAFERVNHLLVALDIVSDL